MTGGVHQRHLPHAQRPLTPLHRRPNRRRILQLDAGTERRLEELRLDGLRHLQQRPGNVIDALAFLGVGAVGGGCLVVRVGQAVAGIDVGDGGSSATGGIGLLLLLIGDNWQSVNSIICR